MIVEQGEITDRIAAPIFRPERAQPAELLACRRQSVDEITLGNQHLERRQNDHPNAVVIRTIDDQNSRQEQREKTIDCTRRYT